MNCPHCKKKITGLEGKSVCYGRVVLSGETPTIEAFVSLENITLVEGTAYFCENCGGFLTKSDAKAIYIMKTVEGLITDDTVFKLDESEMPNYS